MIRLQIDLSKPTTHYMTLWVNALESGLYQHAVTSLHPTDKTHCAYGVFCDLFIKHGQFKWVDSVSDDYYASRYCICRNSTYMPNMFRLLLGITSDIDHALVKLNDTTSTYADVIKYLKSISTSRS